MRRRRFKGDGAKRNGERGEQKRVGDWAKSGPICERVGARKNHCWVWRGKSVAIVFAVALTGKVSITKELRAESG